MSMIVLAQMMDRGDHMDGNGWWWVMGIGGLLILIALIVVIVVALTQSSRSQASPPTVARTSADDVLAERFARGEIDEDEYRRRRAALRE
jgi:putative membrane protein